MNTNCIGYLFTQLLFEIELQFLIEMYQNTERHRDTANDKGTLGDGRIATGSLGNPTPDWLKKRERIGFKQQPKMGQAEGDAQRYLGICWLS